MINRRFPALILLGMFFALAFTQTAYAGVTGFVAGNIIDDTVFTNTSSMSSSDIQSFLNSKVPVCDTWGSQMYNSYQTRAQFAASIGQFPPFTCMKDYYENGKSAAQIIYSVAQQYQINPQILIVLLQKEQGLVTDTWPYVSQYQKATGYGCPDTNVCNTAYYGFTNQITRAANMYHQIMIASSSWYTPYILGNNYILYNPSSSCGGSIVNIQNRATQALYNYTPYQPNQATLDAGWGTAPCGAYGNRNFYLYFTGWFGPTTRPFYAANVNQTAAVSVAPGNNDAPVSFRFKNTGSQAWHDDTSALPNVPRVHLATSSPVNRASIFSANWPNPARPAVNFSAVYESDGITLTTDQHIVQPGQIGEFTVSFHAPDTLINAVYPEILQPVADGSSQWNMGVAVQTNVTVVDQYKSLTAYQPSETITGFQNDLIPKLLTLRFKNTGLLAWHDDTSALPNVPRVHLATSSPVNRASIFSANWPNPARPAVNFSAVYESDGITLTTDQHIVQPGQIGEYGIRFTIPDNLPWGGYSETFKLVADGSDRWDMGAQAYASIWVHAVNHIAKFYTQSQYPTVPLGQSRNGFVAYKNIGNSTWYDDTSVPKGVIAVHLATDNAVNRVSPTASSNWPNPARPAVNFSAVYESDGITLTTDQHIVQPGQIGYFTMPFTNNSIPVGGLSREYLTPVIDGSMRWRMTSQLVWLDILNK